MNQQVDQRIKDFLSILPSVAIEAHIQLAWKCAFECKHCPYFFQGYEPKEQQRIIRKVLLVLSEHNIRHVLFIAPGCNAFPWLPEILEESTKDDLDCDLITGGPMPEADFWFKLGKTGVGNIIFELFGNRVYHDKQTRAGSFDETCSAMIHAMDAGLNVMVVWSLLAGCPEPAEFISALPDRLRGVIMQYYVPFKFGQHIFAQDESAAFALWQRAKTTVSKLPLRYSSCSRSPENDHLKLCSAGRFKLSISPDGTVRPCEHFKPVLASALGNLVNDDLKKIWSSELLALLRKQTPGKYQGKCGNCDDQYFCSACRALGFNFFNDLTVSVPSCQNIKPNSLEF